jgi:Flp pilus assembly CpaE family ATPase
LAQIYGLEFLGAIPLDPATVVAGDLGKPVVLLDMDCPAKRALLDLAERVIEVTENSLEVLSSSHI